MSSSVETETPTAASLPPVQSLQDFDAVVEARNPTTGAFEYLTYYLFTGDDHAFFGKLEQPRDTASLEDLRNALAPVPDRNIFPSLRTDAGLSIAPPPSDGQAFFVKRPNMSMYEIFADEELDDQDDCGFLGRILLAEALILQQLSAHPHPHLAKYHGVRVHRGRITGLVLDRYSHTLLDHVKEGRELNRDEFQSALESAVAHLHSLGLAHNDINPENIMMGEGNLPVLVDFGSCQPFGKRLLTQSTEGWVETVDLYSKQEHDLFALKKLQEWFDNPWFE